MLIRLFLCGAIAMCGCRMVDTVAEFPMSETLPPVVVDEPGEEDYIADAADRTRVFLSSLPASKQLGACIAIANTSATMLSALQRPGMEGQSSRLVADAMGIALHAGDAYVGPFGNVRRILAEKEYCDIATISLLSQILAEINKTAYNAIPPEKLIPGGVTV